MIPKTVTLNIPEIMNASQSLLSMGNTQLLPDDGIKKPDYFSEKTTGAHITIAYPEEGKTINQEDLSQEHSFFIKKLVTAEIGQKQYYVLLVESSSLLQLRKKYQLPDLLSFRGYSIGFHITIGVTT